MSYGKLWQVVLGVVVVMVLVGCGGSASNAEHAAIQRVRAFHEAISAIEPKETFDETPLREAFQEHTTTQLSHFANSPLIILMHNGLVDFTSMQYEIVSESATCAVVRASGNMETAGEATDLDEEYVVVEQGGKWLIDIERESCD